jgi:hypothetical protein
VGNAVGTLTLATAGALLQKTLSLGSAAGQVAAGDAQTIVTQVNTVSALFMFVNLIILRLIKHLSRLVHKYKLSPTA